VEDIVDSSQQNLKLCAGLCQEPVHSSTAHRVCPKILVVLVSTPSSSFVDGYEPAPFIFWIDVPLNNPETHTFHLHHIVQSQGMRFILTFAFHI
jgi:hypothetical protein